MQELYFEILRGKTHIFCNVKDSDTVNELRNIISGILKISPDVQALKKQVGEEWVELSNFKQSLTELGYNSKNAKADEPAVLALVLPEDNGNVNVIPVSSPPPLPEAMRHDHPSDA